MILAEQFEFVFQAAPRRPASSKARALTPEQYEFIFSEASSAREVPVPWRAEWIRRTQEWRRRLALPINRRAEVRLRKGEVLRGKLTLAENQRWSDAERGRLILMVDGVRFRLGEIDSVVHLS
ncbi:MAG: hypothetical protein V4710_17285 [Verrucomicrobiota bacterium]